MLNGRNPEEHPDYVRTRHRHFVEMESLRTALAERKSSRPDEAIKRLEEEHRADLILLRSAIEGIGKGCLPEYQRRLEQIRSQAESHAALHGKSVSQMTKDNTMSAIKHEHASPSVPANRIRVTVRVVAVKSAGKDSRGERIWALVSQDGTARNTATGAPAARKAEMLKALIGPRDKNSSRLVNMVMPLVERYGTSDDGHEDGSRGDQGTTRPRVGSGTATVPAACASGAHVGRGDASPPRVGGRTAPRGVARSDGVGADARRHAPEPQGAGRDAYQRILPIEDAPRDGQGRRGGGEDETVP